MLKLSKLPADKPCKESTAKKMVNTKPTPHLNRLEINALNLSNLTFLQKIAITCINNSILKWKMKNKAFATI